MRWLVRLVTPPGGTVLDPFAGSGSTGAAALAEGRNVILIEREAEYIADIKRRLKAVQWQTARAAPSITRVGFEYARAL
jgi:DNA modification methylase